MAYPFNNPDVFGGIWLALNNKETFLPLMSYLDDQYSAGTFTTLLVGDPSLTDYQYDYAGVGAGTWFEVDGINPPTAPLLRLIDQALGTPTYLFIKNGVLNIGSD